MYRHPRLRKFFGWVVFSVCCVGIAWVAFWLATPR